MPVILRMQSDIIEAMLITHGWRKCRVLCIKSQQTKAMSKKHTFLRARMWRQILNKISREFHYFYEKYSHQWLADLEISIIQIFMNFFIPRS